MLILVCSWCHKVLGSTPSDTDGESGDICPRCCRLFHPEFYQEQKAQGYFKPEQIKEAEMPLTPVDLVLIQRINAQCK